MSLRARAAQTQSVMSAKPVVIRICAIPTAACHVCVDRAAAPRTHFNVPGARTFLGPGVLEPLEHPATNVAGGMFRARLGLGPCSATGEGAGRDAGTHGGEQSTHVGIDHWTAESRWESLSEHP